MDRQFPPVCVRPIRNGGEKRQAKMSDTFKKCRVDSVSVRTEDDYVKALIALLTNVIKASR